MDKQGLRGPSLPPGIRGITVLAVGMPPYTGLVGSRPICRGGRPVPRVMHGTRGQRPSVRGPATRRSGGHETPTSESIDLTVRRGDSPRDHGTWRPGIRLYTGSAVTISFPVSNAQGAPPVPDAVARRRDPRSPGIANPIIPHMTLLRGSQNPPNAPIRRTLRGRGTPAHGPA